MTHLVQNFKSLVCNILYTNENKENIKVNEFCVNFDCLYCRNPKCETKLDIVNNIIKLLRGSYEKYINDRLLDYQINTIEKILRNVPNFVFIKDESIMSICDLFCEMFFKGQMKREELDWIYKILDKFNLNKNAVTIAKENIIISIRYNNVKFMKSFFKINKDFYLNNSFTWGQFIFTEADILNEAVSCKSEDAIKLLLSKEYDNYKITYSNKTLYCNAFTFILFNGNRKFNNLLEYLIKREDYSLQYRVKKGYYKDFTFLHLMIFNNNLKIVKIILEKHPNALHDVGRETNAISLICTIGGRKEILDYLINRYYLLNKDIKYILENIIIKNISSDSNFNKNIIRNINYIKDVVNRLNKKKIKSKNRKKTKKQKKKNKKLRRYKAAKKIQAIIRKMINRSKYIKFRVGIIKFQSIIRGYFYRMKRPNLIRYNRLIIKDIRDKDISNIEICQIRKFYADCRCDICQNSIK